MCYSDFIKQFAKNSGLTQEKSKQVFDVFCKTIEKALLDGEKVEINGVGTVRLMKSKQTAFVNPKTGKKVINKPRRRVSFKPSKVINEKLKKEAENGRTI